MLRVHLGPFGWQAYPPLLRATGTSAHLPQGGDKARALQGDGSADAGPRPLGMRRLVSALGGEARRVRPGGSQRDRTAGAG